MIETKIEIKNPFSKPGRYMLRMSKAGFLLKNKAWEIATYKTNVLVLTEIDWKIKTDHAGIEVRLGIFGYEIHFIFYDTRHWNYKENRYAVPTDKDLYE